MHFERSIDIAAPPEAVWPVVEDVERWHEWTASITDVKRLDSGPFGVGSSARVRQPRLAPATWRVTAYDPPRGFAWATTVLGIRIVGGHWIEATHNGSRVTLELDSSGLLAGMLGRLTRSITMRYLTLESEGLKRRVEGGG